MIGKTNNKLLMKAEAAIEAKVKPAQKNAFQRIVLAGLKVLYADKARKMVASEIKGGGDVAHAVGNGVAKLLGVLLSQSKGTMPMDAAIPAGSLLVCEALDFVEQAGVIKVDAAVLDAATQTMGASFLQLLGVTPEKLQGMMDKARTAKQQPAQEPQRPQQPAQMPAQAASGGLVAQAQGVQV